MSHEYDELLYKQRLPLDIKVKMTKLRIRAWVKEYGTTGVYVSFSGGKDSTVLLHIVREMYQDIPGVFCDTGLEYPEIREFVKTFDNIEWLKPKMNFRQVIDAYGYPFISKEVSQKVYEARQKQGGYAWKRLHDTTPGRWNFSKWLFLTNAPFSVHGYCCNVMKKNPAKQYEKVTGRKCITAQMAQESRVRTTQWLQYGCNAFGKSRPISNPMSFWTENDVLRYIKENNIRIAPVYGDIVYVDESGNQYDEVICNDGVNLETTGCKRTGCMFCGYGCHLDKSPGRFERLKETHPKQYDYIMKPWSEGGLGYKAVIDWINENGNLNIKY